MPTKKKPPPIWPKIIVTLWVILGTGWTVADTVMLIQAKQEKLAMEKKLDDAIRGLNEKIGLQEDTNNLLLERTQNLHQRMLAVEGK